ncbi:thioredoxin domain-containing protein [Robbsia andropogonis]|uniref:redoxin family protein n=1 Tax=Robbsia andropogonis TaxID=28092 RepID=UPI0021B4B781|nr:redoxin family protein [Robbsia andropogonis]
MHLPFPLLSDDSLLWSKALNLPTFSFRGEHYLRRVTLVVADSKVAKVFYPVFPPHLNANHVTKWLGDSAT